MLTFEDDGSLTIDFGDEKVSVKPPKFGAMKRLRAERDRLAIEGGRQIAELGPAPTATALLEEKYPEQPGDGEQPADIPEQTDEDRTALALELAARQRAHQQQVEEINLDVSVQWWRLVLIGDSTFKGLASPHPPADADEWPAALLFDMKPIPRNADGSINYAAVEPSLLDRIFTHWGKVR